MNVASSDDLTRRKTDGLEHLGPPTLGDVLGIGRDLRADIARTEDRVMSAIDMAREDFEGFQVDHRSSHLERSTKVDGSLERLHERLNSYDLEQARRQGAFGLARWTIDLLGRNWKLVATVAISAATFLGNISIQVSP